MDVRSFYSDQVNLYTGELNACKKRMTFFSVYRLVCFLVFAFSMYHLVIRYSTAWLILSLLLAGAFILLVRVALRLNDRKALLEKLLFINQNELAVLNGQPNGMDDGTAFIHTSDYAGDLDIFGLNSLYHQLNRCTTGHGRERLAQLLSTPITDTDRIRQRQQAIGVFAEHTATRQLIMAQGLLHKEEDGTLHSIFEWLKSGQHLHRNKWLQVMRWLVPAYTIPALLYYLATDHVSWLLVGVGAGWLVTAFHSRYILRQHQLIGKKQSVLNQYAGVLRTFSTIPAGDAVLLQQLQRTAGNAHTAINQLSKLSSAFDQRLNLLVNLIINSLFLYDIHCIVRLDAWKEQYKNDFNDWLLAVGDIESLNAQATLRFNHPAFCFPEPVQHPQPYVEARPMAHPLIAADQRVANDFEAGKTDKMLLVTGSNMSGKTTFLRTLGVNLILAQSGSPVCADSFVFTPMEIYTSIRVSDSLQEHTSYFMAELKRLQQIILRLQNGKPALVLIDEILRGTNSEDKTHGSEAFIRQLIQYNCITLFATHDLMLSALEQHYPGVIGNYCFESTIQDDHLYFDYTLQRGVAKNKNASFLMKQMGIIETKS